MSSIGESRKQLRKEIYRKNKEATDKLKEQYKESIRQCKETRDKLMEMEKRVEKQSKKLKKYTVYINKFKENMKKQNDELSEVVHETMDPLIPLLKSPEFEELIENSK